jgi:DNA topoisomerase-3
LVKELAVQLFIAEKPSVAKAIAAELGVTAFGDGFITCGGRVVTWCFGHLLEQAGPDTYTRDDVPRTKTGKKLWRIEDLPIIPGTWILQPKEDAKKQLAVIGRLLKQATEVVHAGDPDREGQLLVDEVLDHFPTHKPILRFWVNAQDSVSIQRGLRNLLSNAAYAGLANAARARQRADWLIGMNLSRAYTLRAQRGGSNALLTVGRVQTPTLALVVSRDRDIEAFKPRPYHTLEARLQHVRGPFIATWKPRAEQAGLDEEGRLIDTTLANALVAHLSGKPGSVTAYTTDAKKKAPPLCFALSDITVLASHKFGYSAEQVLQACQALYETHKLTSYPRTDCRHLPEVQHADAQAVLAALRHVNPELARHIDRANPQLKSPTWNDQKITAHHGIIPTMHAGSAAALSAVERQIYGLIVRRYLAQFFENYEYLQTRVRVEIGAESFAASGHVVTRSGWREIDEVSDAETDKEEEPSTEPLPPMQPQDAVTCGSATRKDLTTKAPPRFTEGSLIRAMEQIHKWVQDPEQKKLLREGDGIGTSATRAAILSDLKRRAFLSVDGKHLCSTALGRALVDALPEAVKSPALTALFERILRDIELGDAALEDFVERQAAFVRERVAQASVGAVTVPALAPTSVARRPARRAQTVRRPRGRRKHKESAT